MTVAIVRKDQWVSHHQRAQAIPNPFFLFAVSHLYIGWIGLDACVFSRRCPIHNVAPLFPFARLGGNKHAELKLSKNHSKERLDRRPMEE